MDSFVNIFSDYLQKSELNELSNSAGSGNFIHVSPALFDIIIKSEVAYKSSHGAFDITIGPLARLWRKARKEKQFPSAASVEEKRRMVGFEKIKIDYSNRSIKLEIAGMQLDLGGIAQGYIAEEVLQRLKDFGVKKALVDVSGDIALGDSPPGRNGWSIGINKPESDQLKKKLLLLHNRSVSTSGDVYQFLEFKGKKYSHIINPITGYGITSQRNVTVIANNTTDADWLATACSILSVRKAKRLVRKMGGEVLIAEKKGTKIIEKSTPHFNRFFQGKGER